MFHRNHECQRRHFFSRDCAVLSFTANEFLLQNYAHTQVPKNFANQTTSQRDRLVYWINSAEIAHLVASVKTTKSKRVSKWRCWNFFLVSIGLEQCSYLDGIQRFHKNHPFNVCPSSSRSNLQYRKSSNSGSIDSRNHFISSTGLQVK